MESWEKNFADDLDLPIKSFRISALEEIIKGGSSEELLRILEEREPREDEEECRLLFSHAILAVKRRLGLLSRDTEILEEKTFLGKLETASPLEKIDLLSNLSMEKTSAFGHFGPSLLEKEKNPAVAATIIRIFGMVWPKDRINDFAVHLRSDSLGVRLATLNVLINIAPGTLEKSLPKLLLSNDPRVRALGIRGLLQLDPDEAVAHLDSLFSSSEKSHKLAAIKNAFFFPFEQVKSILLKFFATETDPGLIDRAGLIFAVNADIEVPYRLWEIAENSGLEKREAVKRIWNDAFSLIEKTRILGEKFTGYNLHLQEWMNRRFAVRVVQETIATLAESKDTLDPEFEATLKAHLSRPEIRKAFQDALDWSIPEPAKERIKSFLAPPQGIQVEFAPEKFSDFESLAPEQKIRLVSSWRPEDLKGVSGKIEEIVSRKETDGDLRAAALRSAIRLGISAHADRCEGLLGNSNSNLSSAALEYLGQFNPDKVFPLLGKFLASTNLRMQKTALRILKKFDPNQGIATIKALLLSRNPVQQEMALPLMIYFEFSTVRPILLTFLETTESAKMFDSGLCFFQANPDPENLYLLFKLEKKVGRILSERVREIRIQCANLLRQIGRLDPEKAGSLEKDFESRFSGEEEKRKAPVPPYSVKKLYPQRQHADEEPLLEKLFSGVVQNIKPLLFSIAVAAVIAFIFVSLRPAADQPITRVSKEQMPFAVTITGTVLEVGDKGGYATLMDDSVGRVYLQARKKEFQTLSFGSKVKALFIPNRVKRPGIGLNGTLLRFEILSGN